MHSRQLRQGPCTILVVDDEPRIVELVSTMLRLGGYDVVQAFGAREALRITNWDGLDLVLCDVRMPEMSGVELAKRLRFLAPELPILFMSGSPNDDHCPPNVLEKPFHMADLYTRVADALSSKSALSIRAV